MALCDKFVTLFMIKQSDFLQIINSSSSKMDYVRKINPTYFLLKNQH